MTTDTDMVTSSVVKSLYHNPGSVLVAGLVGRDGTWRAYISSPEAILPGWHPVQISSHGPEGPDGLSAPIRHDVTHDFLNARLTECPSDAEFEQLAHELTSAAECTMARVRRGDDQLAAHLAEDPTAFTQHVI